MGLIPPRARTRARALTGSRLTPANAVTLARVALVPLVCALVLAGGDAARWWAFAVFATAALTDLVDGWLARRLRDESRWGQLADPLADKALVIGTLAALAIRAGSGWWWWALVVVVAREVGVTAQRQALLRRGLVMPASVFGKLKTVSQLVAVLLLLAPPTPPGLGLTAVGLAVALTVLSGAEYVFRGRRLVRAG